MRLINFIALATYAVTTVFPAGMQAQEPAPIAYFSFDQWPVKDESGNNSKLVVIGEDTSLHCGVLGNSLRLDGIRSEMLFLSPAVFDNFRTGDFSLSFYFKPSNVGFGELDIFSKRRVCTADSSFSIKYVPAANQLKVECSETTRKQAVINYRLPYGRCWQHIAVVRNYNTVLLYVNGKHVASAVTTNRVALNNDQPLSIAKSPCLSTTEKKFSGWLDEIRIYPQALTELQVSKLYAAPDRIANRDTIVFLGDSVHAKITNTCAANFKWSPVEGVSDSTSFSPFITPPRSGNHTYFLRFKDGNCTALDSFHIRVIDPSELDCGNLYVPTAFTPNDDGLNETYGVSNPDALDELLSFEILDAWGGQMFYTEDKKGRWDGTYLGQRVNPGVYMWRARFVCRGKTYTDTGSVTVLR